MAILKKIDLSRFWGFLRKLCLVGFWALLFLAGFWALSNLAKDSIKALIIILCLAGFWALVTLFDVSREAKKVTAEREIYKKTRGGEKPVINWAILAIRAFVLALVLIIAFSLTMILEKKNSQKPQKLSWTIEQYERSKIWTG